jgi:hypothetical protein
VDFVAGWVCPGSLKKSFQMWFYALISISIINARLEFLPALMDVCRANDLNLHVEYVDNVLT